MFLINCLHQATHTYADCFSQDFIFANMESIKLRNHAKRCSLRKQTSFLAPCRKGRFASLHTVCQIEMGIQDIWHVSRNRLFTVPYFFVKSSRYSTSYR